MWQLYSLFKLSERFNESTSGSFATSTTLESFIEEYEQQYDRICNLVAASNYEENHHAYKAFLDSDRAKKEANKENKYNTKNNQKNVNKAIKKYLKKRV